jgi:two-component sensor histidine kinase
MDRPLSFWDRWKARHPGADLPIGRRLALLVVGTSLPVVALLIGMLYRNYEISREVMARSTIETARGMSLAVDRELQRAVAAVQALATAESLTLGDLAEFRSQAVMFIQQYFDASAVILTDRSGQQILNTDIPVGMALPSRRDEVLAERIFVGGLPTVSNLRGPSTSTEPRIVIDVPVRRDGTVIYGLSLTVPAGLFTSLVQQQRQHKGWIISIIDADAVIVARVPGGDQFVGKKASETLLRHLQLGEGMVETTSMEGVATLTGFSHAPQSGWIVAIGLPRDALWTPLLRSLLVSGALGVLFVGIGFAFAVRMARHIAHAAEHRELLIHELNHRVKNTLATVQSLAYQTLRSAPNPADARKALDARLVALSQAHDVLTRESWEAADIRELVGRALHPFQTGAAARIRLRGPDVRVKPKMAIALSMALHELATNAVKYGALSVQGGRVAVEWQLLGDGAARRLRLVWRETGGPPVTTPAHRGFGTRLIASGIGDFGAEPTIEFKPEGLVCVLEAPLDFRDEAT